MIEFSYVWDTSSTFSHIAQDPKAEYRLLALAVMLFPKAGAAVDEGINNYVNARSLSAVINIKPCLR